MGGGGWAAEGWGRITDPSSAVIFKKALHSEDFPAHTYTYTTAHTPTEMLKLTQFILGLRYVRLKPSIQEWWQSFFFI